MITHVKGRKVSLLQAAIADEPEFRRVADRLRGGPNAAGGAGGDAEGDGADVAPLPTCRFGGRDRRQSLQPPAR